MEIQPIVIGTAGHIDHGKSSLVKALTGIDPDRLKEEKERGLTIDLGFARMQLADGRTVGLIDVPGHERFVRNMVAGATGIDLVILVVAADDGVMPQTREHLDIMGLLGLRRGFVALNKIDLVEPELADLAELDVREALKGTFLEAAPIVRVSATTGAGLIELRALLERMAAEGEPRAAEGVFRLPIQRVFSAKGFGTVLTGVPVSGSVRVGDVLEVLPSRQKGKLRGIQAYGETTARARAGHSSALNLADVDHHRVARGDVVATPGFFAPVRMVAARLKCLARLGFEVHDRMQVRLHTGTADPLGELVLLDKRSLAPGEEGLVQVRLEQELVCAPGDPFILRLASPSITLGGGAILEESKHRLKRFKGFVIEELSRQEQSLGSPEALLESMLARGGAQLVSTPDLASMLKRDPHETAGLLESLRARGAARALGAQGRWIHADALEQALGRLRQALEGHFRENPHRKVVESLELRRRTGFEPLFLDALQAELALRGEVALLPGGLVAPAGRTLALDQATSELRDKVLQALEAGGYQPPAPEELAARLACKPQALQRVLALLADEGAARRIAGDLWMHASFVERAREAVVENCGRHGHLEIPELRDRLGTTRKFLIPLLEHFDAAGLTIRQGANRVLKRRA